MPVALTGVRVVLATPGGPEGERTLFRKTLSLLPRGLGSSRDPARLRPVTRSVCGLLREAEAMRRPGAGLGRGHHRS